MLNDAIEKLYWAAVICIVPIGATPLYIVGKVENILNISIIALTASFSSGSSVFECSMLSSL